jgi:hypothetical protein
MMPSENDRTIVEQAAREVLDRHGREAVPILRERAEIADELDDEVAATAWRDIADAAAQIYDRTPTAKPYGGS